MGKLDGKVALVTGGAQGIGRACAKRLVDDGARVVVMDVNGQAGAAAVAEMNASATSAAFVQGDVSTKDGANALVAAARERFGRVDALVNNAGIVHGGDFLDLAEEDFDRVLQLVSNRSDKLRIHPSSVDRYPKHPVMSRCGHACKARPRVATAARLNVHDTVAGVDCVNQTAKSGGLFSGPSDQCEDGRAARTYL